MNGSFWLEIVLVAFVAIGALLSLAAAIGLIRFQDVMTRLHSQSKPQSAGLLFLLIAVGLQQGNWQLVPMLVLVFIFQMLTTPAASIVLARSGYRSKHYEDVELHRDELAADVARAERAAAAEYEREQQAAREQHDE